jgi:UDP-3-O-[3-hydroxymyristoyl] N-acetylglucosamine deacetylase
MLVLQGVSENIFCRMVGGLLHNVRKIEDEKPGLVPILFLKSTLEFLMQFTVEKSLEFSGVSLHSGREVKVALRSAPVNSGIVFVKSGRKIPALFDQVAFSPLCTMIVGEHGESISTIEHFMAAAWAAEIDNLIVEVQGDEMPVLDGSALPFLHLINRAGRRGQLGSRKEAFLNDVVEVRLDEAWARLSPASSFTGHISIDFDESAIGRQECYFSGKFVDFVSNLASARTFCRARDIEVMHAQGKALGGSLENALVFDGDKVLSPGGLRMECEPVRHKMLDAIGDLALLGSRMNARFESHRPGHRLTNLLLRKAVEVGAFQFQEVQPANFLDPELSEAV